MGPESWKLFTAVFLGLICSSLQQVNNAPYFLTLSSGSGVDGNLLDRLTKQGILENTPVGTTVGQLSCQDRDVGDYIAGYSVDSQTLAVATNGEVTTTRVLDRELYTAGDNNNTELTKYLKPTFYCWDNRQLTTTVEVDITLTDVNDNAPEFINLPYKTNVPEDTIIGSTIFTGISIRDVDQADNARVTVSCFTRPDDPESIISCEFFSIMTIQTGAGRYKSSVILRKTLDFENKRGYTMTLLARDLAKGGSNNPPLQSSVNVLIDVIDTQDTPPQFLNVPLTIYVRENVPVGSRVQLSISAQDGDQGNARPIKIRIKDDPQSLFRLGESVKQPTSNVYVANVIVNGNIDRETLQGTYEFEVEAVELENTTETNDRTSANVRVDILDENDNRPTFSQSVYNVTLYEIDNNQSNFQVPDLTIQITDTDNPSNAQYHVVIASQSQNTFRVFPDNDVTGNVAVNLEAINPSLLDYDVVAYRRQTVILEARELNTFPEPPQTSTATVNIILRDLNDNSPEFTQATYIYSRPEDTPVNTVIATVQATDKDEGLNGQITYSLSGTGSEQFTIDGSTGVITLARPLDYETNKIYQILVEAIDAAQPPRKTSKTLTLHVTNVNDEGPTPVREVFQTFAQETNLTLRPAVLVQAVDNEDERSNITYRIIAGNTADDAFMVNTRTGEFTLTKMIDYDDAPYPGGVFEVIIQASDNGNPPQYANMTVRVKVQDENNNAPRFNSLNYFANISELAPQDTLVVTVAANDLDGGTNGKIRYTIQSGGREHFKISESSGVITVSDKAQFDFDVFPEYNMIVYAIDYGSPPKTGTTTVQVEVRDANNKSPQFAQQIYVLSVPEDKPIGSSVLSVTATDPDTTRNLVYSIPTSTVQARNSGGKLILAQNSFDFRNAFVVDSVRGIISTNRTLARELAAEISFNVVVEDLNAGTSERQSATTSVLITILGTDVSTIYFTPATYTFSVTEGKTTGYLITTVAARDPACGNCLIRNYIEVPNTDSLGYLQVEADTGRVTLSKTINYEEPESRQLYMEIEARADDGRTARTSVRVEVRDDNDNSPLFRKNYYEFSVSETALYPFRVGYVKASDADSGSFSVVEYSLSGQGATDFQIFDTGMILVSLSASLDFEKTKVYNLLVTAADNPTNRTSTVRRQTSVPLQINILDENDNKPQFGTIFPFFVVENFEIGQSVGRIVATDGDAGTNGEIYFSMKDPSNLFRITNNGYILTQRSLRDMSPQSPFIVTVRAEDRGIPSLYNETSVEINVRSGQLDDGRPQWSIPRLGVSYTVIENTTKVQVVVQARAQAKSVTPAVNYSFSTEGDDHHMFRIDPETGNITTVGVFDREKKSVYDLILIATDAHNNTLQSLRGLTVRVIDVNDNVPDFGNCPGVTLEVPQTVIIPEDAAVDTFVYKVKACDLDEVVNGVYYEEETDIELCKHEMAEGYFRVNRSGVIILNKTLDRETKPHHLVCIRAFPSVARRKRQADGFNRQEMVDTSHVAYIVITVLDKNDNGPVFTYPGKSLSEAVATVPTKKSVVRVSATDPDLPPFNRVRYSIEGIKYHEPDYPAYELAGSFVIGPDTGIVSVNFPSYSDFRIPNSYFNITIQAEDFKDTSKKDFMNLFVFIFEPSQTLRVVIEQSPDKAKPEVDNLMSDLVKADPESLFKLQQVSYHRVVNNFDVTRTDVCFVVVKKNKVLSVSEGSNTLHQNKIDSVLKQYGATSPGSCYRSRSSLDKIDWAPLWWVLVALAIFIFICCCILIAVICILHRNYKNYMRTRKTYLVQQ